MKRRSKATRYRNLERRTILNLIQAHRSMLFRVGTIDYGSLTAKVLEELSDQIRNSTHRGGPR